MRIRPYYLASAALVLVAGCSRHADRPYDAAVPTDLAVDAAMKLDAGEDLGADGFIEVPDSGALTILHAFDGDHATAATGRGKPEMNVASNGTLVGQVSSQGLNVYDYTGHLQQTTTLTALVTGAGLVAAGGSPTPYEPHVVFDEFIQRWVITATCKLDCVLVSDGANPVGATWQGFYLDGNGADPAIHLAYDKNGAYFSETVLSAGNPDTATCCTSNVFAIPGAELQWTNATPLNPVHRNKTTGKPHELMVVNDHDPTKGASAPAMFVSRTCPPGSANCQGNSGALITNEAFEWIVSYGTWSGTTFTMTSNHTSACAGGAAPSDQCVHTDPNGTSDRWLYNTPIDPGQPGTTGLLRAAEIHRIIDAVQQGSHVHVVLGSGPCASGCGAHGVDSGGDIFLWADLDCTTLGACVVHQTQKVSGADNYLWPTVGVDPSGNVGIFANAVQASTSKYLGIEAWQHHAGDPAGVLAGPTVITAGTTAYVCSLGAGTAQTGNPAGVSTLWDPLQPAAMWVTEQYANDSGDCHWSTRIFEYAF